MNIQWDDSCKLPDDVKEIYNVMDTKTLDNEKDKWLTTLQDAVLHFESLKGKVTPKSADGDENMRYR